MKDIYIYIYIYFFFEKSYTLRNNSTLKRTYIRSVYLGTETISFLALKIWELVPNTIKNATSLKLFKKQIKLWTTDECTCRLCKICICSVGFVYVF